MQNASHPDDERLAAFAGGDRDALDDRELAEHVTACDRCRPLVDELTSLQGALAALPDLAPSRPLRLIPPVPAQAARGVGPLEWLRRLAAPAMAAGAGLVLIGAVGASGIGDQLIKEAGRMNLSAAGASDNAGAPGARESTSPVVAPGSATEGVTDGSAFGSRSNPPATRAPGDMASSAPVPSEREGEQVPVTSSSDEQPWLTLLIAGVALFATSTVLRFSLAPRAG